MGNVAPLDSMTADQETFVKTVMQALAEWLTDLGTVAWLILGVLLISATVLLLACLRWIVRGGLSHHLGLSFSRRFSENQELFRRDS